MVDISESFLASLYRVLPFATLIFVIVHATLRALPDPDAYEKAAELFTHAFAVPAILRARHMREQIIVATIVSLLYHAVRNYSSLPDADIASYQRLDHAMSVALIATVFLKYFSRLTHVIGIITLLSGLSASFPFGNVLSSALTALIFVIVITFPLLDQAVYSVISYVVWVLSLGGIPPRAGDINLGSFRKRLFLALSLQGLSVVFYLVGENNEDLQRWAHSLWHTFAFLALFVLVDVLALREDKENGVAPVRRASRKQFYNILR